MAFLWLKFGAKRENSYEESVHQRYLRFVAVEFRALLQQRRFVPIIIGHLLAVLDDERDDRLLDVRVIVALLDLAVQVLSRLRLELALDMSLSSCVLTLLEQFLEYASRLLHLDLLLLLLLLHLLLR
jgi:hypothetical protein